MSKDSNRTDISKSFKKNFSVFVRNRSLLIGSIMILIVVLSAIFADVIAPYEYDYADMSNKLLRPSGLGQAVNSSSGRTTLDGICFPA